MKKLIISLVALAALALVIAGCAPQEEDVMIEKEEVMEWSLVPGTAHLTRVD